MADTTADSANTGDLDVYPQRRVDPLHPAPFLRQRRSAQPIAKVRIWDGSDPWLVTRYDDYRDALADDRLSADARRPGYPGFTKANGHTRATSPTFISLDEPEHGYFRKMLLADFSVRHVEALRPRVRELISDLLDRMDVMEQPVDLTEAFTLPLASTIICLVMGIPYDFHTEFQDYAKAITSDQTTIEGIGAVEERLHGFYREFFEQKRADPQDDLLTRLVVDRLDTGQLTEKQLLAMLDLLFVAGHDTTANQIALGMVALAQQPDQAALLTDSEDPEILRNAIEDLLRFVTITHWGRRRVAIEDIEIGGQLIRAGEGVIVASESANRDAETFADPDQLDFNRSAAGHVAFGFGIHQCLGQHLARLELTEAYPALLRRLHNYRVAVPLDELPFKGGSIVYGIDALPLVWDRSEP